MPTVSGDLLLDSARLNLLIQDQAARYANEYPLDFLDRLRMTEADDDEITAVVRDRFLAADIVADDQEAAVYDSQTVSLIVSALPNIKSGSRLNQKALSVLNRLRNNPAERGDRRWFEDWQSRFAFRAVHQCYQQADALSAALYLDTLSYARNGVVISVASFGMPSDLKATPSTPWTTAASATPVTDILTMKNHSQTTYGRMYNRLTIGTPDLLLAFATAEFKAQLASLAEIRSPLAASAFGTYDLRNQAFFSEMLRMQVVVCDRTNRTKNPDGTETTTRVLPTGKVVLDNSDDDGTGLMADFANAPVVEALAASVVRMESDIPAGVVRGPVGYYTARSDFNPPNVTAWGVMRGFPRKFDVYSSALLTVQ